MKLIVCVLCSVFLVSSCSTFFASSPRAFRDYPFNSETPIAVAEGRFRIAPVPWWSFKPAKEETIDVSTGIVKPLVQIGDLPKKVRSTMVSSRGRWTIEYYLSSFDSSTTISLKESPSTFTIVKQSLSPNDDMKMMPFEFMVVEVSGKIYHLVCCRDYSLKYAGAIENPSNVLFTPGQRLQVVSEQGQVLGELSERELYDKSYFAEQLWEYLIFSGKDTSELRVVFDFVASWLHAGNAGKLVSERAGFQPWDYEKLTKELNLSGTAYDIL